MFGKVLYDGLLPRELPHFTLPSLESPCRGLVLGMGGGCDVFAAFALARAWAGGVSGEVLYGNCISPRPLPNGHTLITPHLVRCPPDIVALTPGDEAYGSTRLEESLPRGPDGSPLLFVVPSKGGGDATVEEVTRENSAAMGTALTALNLDVILAVDCGGDSLTGGLDFVGGEHELAEPLVTLTVPD